MSNLEYFLPIAPFINTVSTIRSHNWEKESNFDKIVVGGALVTIGVLEVAKTICIIDALEHPNHLPTLLGLYALFSIGSLLANKVIEAKMNPKPKREITTLKSFYG